MKSLEDLLGCGLEEDHEPAIALIRKWIASASNDVEILPPASNRDQILLDVQLSIFSTLGAVIYETGGLLVDHGWLRFLGSGTSSSDNNRLTRVISDWNNTRSDSFFLFADDTVGGFFALNGGALGSDLGQVYYWPPDSLVWEALELGYSDFLRWSLTEATAEFCQDLRWDGWQEDVASLSGDQCFSFAPPLWTREGHIESSSRAVILAAEAFDVKMDMLAQLTSD